MAENVVIGERRIGSGEPAFIIAEVGVNHNGDMDLARALVDAAAAAGADAVKFQTWKTELVIHRTAPKAEYQKTAAGDSQTQFDMVRKLELGPEQFQELAERCRTRGTIFLSTAFDEESLDLVVGLGVPLLKIPSGEIDNPLLLRAAARTGRPLVLSTGMSDLIEVRTAIDHLRRSGAGAIIVMQCTSNYPAATDDANLRAIPVMADAFDVVVGYSDHTLGSETAIAARALGASVFEKHVTLDKSLPGPDHQASASMAEFADYVAALRKIEAALGSGVKIPSPREQNVKAVARRSLFLRQSVKAGELIEEKSLIALRPAGGLPPSQLDQIVGRFACRDLKAGEALSWTDLATDLGADLGADLGDESPKS